MGTAEIDDAAGCIFIHSHIVTYGNESTQELTRLIGEEIECMWNEPNGKVIIDDTVYQLIFRISHEYKPGIDPIEILSNTDPRCNYFRIEKYATENISFVDGVGSNTGYFLLENLYAGSTTAAHEYGHTLGLSHPHDMDLRGKGIPGIMYPRGTLVDAPYQYNPDARPGDSSNGGTMHPKNRKVLQSDIDLLRLDRLSAEQNLVGEFTSIWHPDHTSFNT